MNTVSEKQAIKARDKVRSLLKNRPEFLGVGFSIDSQRNYCIEVRLSTALLDGFSIPEKVDGVKVNTEIVGNIRFIA